MIFVFLLFKCMSLNFRLFLCEIRSNNWSCKERGIPVPPGWLTSWPDRVTCCFTGAVPVGKLKCCSLTALNDNMMEKDKISDKWAEYIREIFEDHRKDYNVMKPNFASWRAQRKQLEMRWWHRITCRISKTCYNFRHCILLKKKAEKKDWNWIDKGHIMAISWNNEFPQINIFINGNRLNSNIGYFNITW